MLKKVVRTASGSRRSGFSLAVTTLDPGDDDVAVFARSTATGGFVPARTVRITSR